MPPLPNPRHEKFAKAIAKGKPKVRAYEESGYSPDRGNAVRLTTKDSVAARIIELQSMDVRGLKVDREFSRNMFLNNYNLAIKSGNLSAANVAAEKLAKLFGLMVERREVGAAGEFSQLSDAQLIEILAEPLDAFRDSREEGDEEEGGDGQEEGESMS